MNTFLTQPTPEVINAENEIAALVSGPEHRARTRPHLQRPFRGRLFLDVCRYADRNLDRDPARFGHGRCRVCYSRLRVGSQSPWMPTASATCASIIGFSRLPARQMKITLSTESSGGASPAEPAAAR